MKVGYSIKEKENNAGKNEEKICKMTKLNTEKRQPTSSLKPKKLSGL